MAEEKYTDKFLAWLVAQTKAEYDFSISKVTTKRNYLKRNLELYANVIEEDNKIADRTIFEMCDMMCALDHKFKPKVNFAKRKLGDETVAKNLDRVKQFDYDEMDMPMLEYWVSYYKFIFGIGLRVSDGYDKVSEKPRYKVMNPLSRVPDVGFDPNYGFRFEGFEMDVMAWELTKEQGFFNVGSMKSAAELAKWKTTEQQQNDQAMQKHRLISGGFDYVSQSNGVYSIYEHRTTYALDGKKYIITLANDRSLPIRVREIYPVFAEEKKDTSKIHLGVIHERWRPIVWDPYGLSLAFDLLSDKQKARQVLYNLNLIKAKFEALGDVFFYDSNLITDTALLAKQSDKPKYIPVKWLAQNPNPMAELPKQRVKNDAAMFPEILWNMASRNISLDDRSLGVSWDNSITKGESDRTQLNTNLRHLLGVKFSLQAQKEFRRHIRYRSYYENFKGASEKFLYLTNGIGQIPMTVKRKDFITENDINIQMISPLDEEETMREQRELMLWFYPTLYENAISPFSKKEVVKYVGKILKMDDERLNMVLWETPEETQAKQDLIIINNGELPKIHSMTENHDTYIAIFNQAIDGPAKFAAIQARMEAKLLSNQMIQQQQMWESWLDPAQRNQLTSNAISKMNEQKASAPSLQDISV